MSWIDPQFAVQARYLSLAVAELLLQCTLLVRVCLLALFWDERFHQIEGAPHPQIGCDNRQCRDGPEQAAEDEGRLRVEFLVVVRPFVDEPCPRAAAVVAGDKVRQHGSGNDSGGDQCIHSAPPIGVAPGRRVASSSTARVSVWGVTCVRKPSARQVGQSSRAVRPGARWRVRMPALQRVSVHAPTIRTCTACLNGTAGAGALADPSAASLLLAPAELKGAPQRAYRRRRIRMVGWFFARWRPSGRRRSRSPISNWSRQLNQVRVVIGGPLGK